MSGSRSLDREMRKARAESALGLRPSAMASTLIALEPRMIFDGAVAATVDAIARQAAEASADHAAEKGGALDVIAAPDSAVTTEATIVPAAPVTAPAASAPVEVVFIDSRVPDAQAFAAAAGHARLVVTVSADQDGLAVITDVLQSLGSKASALHIVGHGREGAFTLGEAEIDARTVADGAGALAGWRAHLSDGADILLYGCDTGAGAEGARLLQAIAAGTGADVAASVNDTGSAAGADWVLERSTGSIDARVVAPEGWNGHLAAPGAVAELGGVDRTGLQVWLDASKLTSGAAVTAAAPWANQASSALTGVGTLLSGTSARVLSDARGNYVDLTGTSTIGLGSSTQANRSIFLVLEGQENLATKTSLGLVLSQDGNNFLIQRNNFNGQKDGSDLFQLLPAASTFVSGESYYQTQVMTMRFFGQRGVAETADIRSTAGSGLTATGATTPAASGNLRLSGYLKVREVVIFGRSLNLSETRAVEAALAAKWGVNEGSGTAGVLYKPAFSGYGRDVTVVSRSDRDAYVTASNGGLTVDGTNFLTETGASFGWGHDGGDLSTWSPAQVGGVGNETATGRMLGRVWGIDTSNTRGRVDLAVDLPTASLETLGSTFDIAKLRVAYRAGDTAGWQLVASGAATLAGTQVRIGGVLVNQGGYDLKDGQMTLVYLPDLPAARLQTDAGAGPTDLRSGTSAQRILVLGAGEGARVSVSTDGLTFDPVVLTSDGSGNSWFDRGFPAGTTTLFLRVNDGRALPFSLDLIDTAQTVAFGIDPPSATLNALSPSPPATVITVDAKGAWTITTNEFVGNTQTQALQRIAQVVPRDPSQGPYTYALNVTSDLFSIDPTTGWLMVASGKALDREKLGADGVAARGKIVITKAVGETAAIDVTIVLRDVNDAPAITATAPTAAVAPAAAVTFSADDSTGAVVKLTIRDDDQALATTQDRPVQLDLTANTVNPGVFSVDADDAKKQNVTVFGNNTWSLRLIGTKAAIEGLLPSVQVRAAVADATSIAGTATYSDLGNSDTGGTSLTASASFSIRFDNWPVSFTSDGLQVTLGQASFAAPADATSTGVAIQSLFSSGVAGGPSNIRYANPSSDGEWGLAVTDVGSSGTWWYRLNGSASWTRLSIEATKARLLPSTALLYFERGTGDSGASGSLTVRVWDRYGSGIPAAAEASLVDTEASTKQGLVSSASATIVARTNTRPVAGGNVTLPQVLASIEPGSLLTDGRTGPIGLSVPELVRNATDADGPGTMGAAVTAISGNGTWWITFNNAATWTRMSSIPTGRSLLLAPSSNTRIFYQATAAEASDGATSATLTVRAWDMAGQAGAGNVLLTPAASATSTTDIRAALLPEASPFSSSASVVALAANTSPGLATPTPAVSLRETSVVPTGASSFALVVNSGVSIRDIVAALGSNYIDTNSGQARGLAVSGGRTMAYSVDGGLTWRSGDGYSWIFLQADGNGRNRISIQPAADGTALSTGLSGQVTVRAWDGSVMANGMFLWSSETVDNAARMAQAEAAQSSTRVSVTLTVAPVAPFNERPVLDTTKQWSAANPSRTLTAFSLRDLPQNATKDTGPWTTVAALLGNGVSDRDTASTSLGIAVTGVSGGTLFWRSASGTVTEVKQALSTSNALLLPRTAWILFLPTDQKVGGTRLTGVTVAAFDTNWSGLVGGITKTYAGFTPGSIGDSTETAQGSNGVGSAFSSESVRLALNVLDVTAPRVTASGANPAFQESEISAKSAGVTLFTNATVSLGTTTNDALQKVTSLVLTVSNVKDGANEILMVDGTEVVLRGGAAVTTSENELTIAVALTTDGPQTATVTITSSGMDASKAQTVLNGLQYKNTSDMPTEGSRVVTITSLTDSGAANNTWTGTIASTVTVTSRPDLPTLAGLSTVPVSEGGAASLAPSVSIGDRENQFVKGIDVLLSEFDQAVETLAFTPLPNFDYSLTQEDGQQRLTIRATGDRTYAQWQSALATVSYRYGGDNPPTNRTVTYRVLDATSTSQVPVYGTATQQVAITAVNDAPTAPAETSVTTREDTASARVDIGASDIDGATLTYAVKEGSGPRKGTVTFSNGGFVYTPKADANGEDVFTIEVSDGTATVTQAVTVTITAVNDAPTVPAETSVTAREDTASARVDIGASDIDGATLSYAVKEGSGPRKGTVTFSNGGFTYTPKADANGEDGFTIEVTDGSATVTQAVTVTITPVNDAPTAPAETSVTTREDTASARVDIGASDIDGATLTYAVKEGSGPRKGTVTFSNGGFVYTPMADANGEDGFTIEVSDGTVTVTQAVTVTITAVNDAPTVPSETSVTTREDTASARVDIGAFDIDGTTLTYAVKDGSGPRKGTVTFSDGGFVYTPMADANGEDGFTIEVSDGAGGTVRQAVTVLITPVNDGPTAPATRSVTLDEDTSRTVAIEAADIDGTALAYAMKEGSGPRKGTVTFSDGGFVYTPMANANGEDSFTIEVTDGAGGKVEQAVTVTITPVNDEAVIGDAVATSVTEDQVASDGRLAVSGTLAISDVDAGDRQFQTKVTVVGQPRGTLEVTPDGLYTYSVPNAAVQDLPDGATLTESFLVYAVDGTPKRLSFFVTGANDAAFIGNPPAAAVMEDVGVVAGRLVASGRLSIDDADGGEAAFDTAVSPAAGTLGTLTLAADGTYSYAVGNALVQALGSGEARVDTFTVRSRDGTEKAIRFVVNGANDAAVGAVTVSGTAVVGQTLAASADLADREGLGPVTIVWQRDGIDIPGATGPSYTLVGDDANRAIRAVARYTDGAGTAEEVASATVLPQVVTTQAPATAPQTAPSSPSSATSTSGGTGTGAAAASTRVTDSVTAASTAGSDDGAMAPAPRVNLLVTTTRGEVLGSGVTGSSSPAGAGERIEYQSRVRAAFVELTVKVKEAPSGEGATASAPPRNLEVARADGTVIPGAVVLPNGAILLPRGLAVEQVLVTFRLPDGTEVRQLLRVDLGEGSLDLIWDDSEAPPPPTFMQQLALLAAEAAGWRVTVR